MEDNKTASKASISVIIVDMGEWRVIVDLGQSQYGILSIGPIKVTLFKKVENIMKSLSYLPFYDKNLKWLYFH